MGESTRVEENLMLLVSLSLLATPLLTPSFMADADQLDLFFFLLNPSAFPHLLCAFPPFFYHYL